MSHESERRTRADLMRSELYSRHRLEPATEEDTLPTTREVMSLGSDIAWGELWTRKGLDKRARSISSLSIVAASGWTDQIRFHVSVALNNGLTPNEIVELIFHVGFYAGFPANAVAQEIATEVFRERGVLPTQSPASEA